MSVVTGIPIIPLGGTDLTAVFKELERALIAQAVVRANGNKAKAARLLGLKRTTLRAKMKKLGYPKNYKPTKNRKTGKDHENTLQHFNDYCPVSGRRLRVQP